MQLTIIIPIYNEIKTIKLLLKKVLKLKIKKQIIIVDDLSTDGSREFIISKKNLFHKLILHKRNMGKGSAIISSKRYIRGKYVIIQDADLEYDPNDYHKLLKEIKSKNLKVVYGSRVLKKNMYANIQNFSHVVRIWGNIFLTKISNFINNQNLTDAHTCYKLIESKIFKSIILKEKDFSFCPEITTKISLLGLKIKEVPIKYKGRTYKAGKKIGTIDGLRAIRTLIKYRFF